MEMLDRRIFGIIILLLWAMLVFAKRWATGSLLEATPHGSAWIWLVHVFNFSFLLVANPLAAMLLVFSRARGNSSPGLTAAMDVVGMFVSATGYILLALALVALGRNYQVGGNQPRPADELVTHGPYRLVRHPMYTAAVSIALGLACLTRSLAYFGVFCIYVVVVLVLVPFEERKLQEAYGERYAVYQKSVKRLVPLIY